MEETGDSALGRLTALSLVLIDHDSAKSRGVSFLRYPPINIELRVLRLRRAIRVAPFEVGECAEPELGLSMGRGVLVLLKIFFKIAGDSTSATASTAPPASASATAATAGESLIQIYHRELGGRPFGCRHLKERGEISLVCGIVQLNSDGELHARIGLLRDLTPNNRSVGKAVVEGDIATFDVPGREARGGNLKERRAMGIHGADGRWLHTA
jgi:hypothetical protein